MINECVLLKDGRTIIFQDITNSVSADIYQDDLHYQVCESLADKYEIEKSLHQVLVNLLALKSFRAREITALCWYIENYKSNIVEVFAYDDVCLSLKSQGLGDIIVNQLGIAKVPLVTRRQTITVLVKAILHKLFRLFSRKPKVGVDVVRGWVEVTESMYPDIIRTAEVRVYPFPYGIIRQINFINKCRKLGVLWSFDGLPYSFKDIFRIVFAPNMFEIAITQLEYNAFSLYSREVMGWNPNTIYTSDEYEVGSVAFYSILTHNNIKSVNTAHGIGWYCPYVAYSEFRVFNHGQGDFYRKRNSSMALVLRERNNAILPIDYDSCRNATHVAFVLIHQNFDDFQMPAERSAQLRLGNLIKEASAKCKVPYFVKLHPNTRPSDVTAVSRSLWGDPLIEWKTLTGYRPIFILINSTTFFELRDIAPVLVYSAPSFKPELYFESGYNTVCLESCKEILVSLLNLDMWEKSFQNQCSANIFNSSDSAHPLHCALS
ncbi:MAG TPA: hypothetical protein HPP94_01835 [Desulfuromonadales bacterium]|nr:hypothetical protein [Desulfuromonadales bacterium]